MRGSINDARLWNGATTGRRELRARIDELGGPNVHNNYPWGWTMAGNTPFKRWKREVHEGGVADPCIVRLPASARGNANAGDDPAPVRARDRRAPDRARGHRRRRARRRSRASRSRRSTARACCTRCRRPTRPSSTRRSTSRCSSSRAIYHQGWKAVTFHALGAMYDDGLDPNAPFDDDVWELYHKAVDVSETEDLAAKEPERLAGDGRPLVGGGAPQRRAAARQPAAQRDPQPAATPARRARAATCTARTARRCPKPTAVHLPEPRAHDHRRRRDPDGRVRRTASCSRWARRSAGSRFYLLDGRLRYVHNLYGKERHVDRLRRSARAGLAPARVRVHEDDGSRGHGRAARRRPRRGRRPTSRCSRRCSSPNTGGGMTCGYEVGPSVGDDYVAPFRCNVADPPRGRRRRGRARTRPDGGVPGDHVGAVAMRKLVRRASPRPSSCCVPLLGAHAAGAQTRRRSRSAGTTSSSRSSPTARCRSPSRSRTTSAIVPHHGILRDLVQREQLRQRSTTAGTAINVETRHRRPRARRAQCRRPRNGPYLHLRIGDPESARSPACTATASPTRCAARR